MADTAVPNVSSEVFPAADVESEVVPPEKNSLEVDPNSAEVEATKEIEKKQDEVVVDSGKKSEKKDTLQTLTSVVIVSAVIVAVAGAIFAITKKLKEK